MNADSMQRDPGQGKPTNSRESSFTVALVGNPNTGKSSLFNALCGLNARVGNFPGVTVEKKLGTYRDGHGEVTVVDLPGTYSLSARSADEMVSVDVLLSRLPDAPRLDGVVVIVDATNIERNLYLFSQVRELELPVLLVLNMWDRIEEEGVSIDCVELSKRLGVPVLTTSAHRRTGVEEVKQRIRRLQGTSCPVPARLFPQVFEDERRQLVDWIQQKQSGSVPMFLAERTLLDVGGASEVYWKSKGHEGIEAYLQQARERLQQQGCRVPTIETKIRYGWVRQQLDGIVIRKEQNRITTSDRIDQYLTHRFWGVALFLLVMFLIFQSVYVGDKLLGSPLGWNEDGLFGGMIAGVQSWLTQRIEEWIPVGPLQSLLNDGIVAGVGGVLVFLPQIAFLFLFIAILEDCGYMARVAFLMDKLMTKLGLSGKSFLPLLSSFACAVPGIMATRVIESRRDRMVTILVAPLMSCSARVPVYVLMASSFVPATSLAGGWISLQAIVLFAMQLIGALIAIPVAWALKRWMFTGQTPPFVMELPAYKWPSWRVVFQRVWERIESFVVRAGTLILLTSIVIWAAGYFPADHSKLIQLKSELATLEASSPEPNPEEKARLTQEINTESSRLIEHSFLGWVGKGIEPVVRPLGWDWRIGVGVLASFPAREVVVATFGTIFSLGSEVDENDEGLRDQLQGATWPDGRPLFDLPVALSIMIFFALCAQCAATLMVIRRETNSWRWPLFTFVYMTGLAYGGAWLVYQIGSWWTHA